MTNIVGTPLIGQWYERADSQEVFQVTGVDDRARTVEIQLANGDIGEIDQDTWIILPLSYAESPEDWLETSDEMEAADSVSLRAETALEDPAALERLS